MNSRSRERFFREKERAGKRVRLFFNQLEHFGPVQASGRDVPVKNKMRELRVQCAGQPYRVLYAFDPRRCAMLLIGGNKTGNDRWYEEHVPQAETLYEAHLRQLTKEGLL